MKNDLRVTLTQRLLKEGLLRCLRDKPLSKITVADLCRESGVNRGTFYNHYATPEDIVRDIAWEYASMIRQIYEENRSSGGDKALVACLTMLAGQRDELKILFSENAENVLAGCGLEIVHDLLRRQNSMKPDAAEDQRFAGDDFLRMIITSSATFGLILIWISQDIPKTPEEIAALLREMFPQDAF